MPRLQRLLIFLIISWKLQDGSCSKYSMKWKKWATTDVTYGTAAVQNGLVSLSMCLRRCEETKDCVSVQVNRANSSCELSNYYPPYYTLIATPRIGWTVYFRDLRQVQGTRAWMSSTMSDCSAGKAIDGQLFENFAWPGCQCAHSYSVNSYWIMEFQSSGTVVMITPFFRLITPNIHRNTDFRLLVYPTFDDAMNNVSGVLCSEYTGAGIIFVTNFICKQQPNGGALRLQHFLVGSDAFLQFCEMKVYIV